MTQETNKHIPVSSGAEALKLLKEDAWGDAVARSTSSRLSYSMEEGQPAYVYDEEGNLIATLTTECTSDAINIIQAIGWAFEGEEDG
jgi:hypothetical protein